MEEFDFSNDFFPFAEYNSERKYWQNVYHHLDRNPVADDAIVTVSSSLGRDTLKILTRNDLMCSQVVFAKLLQTLSFHEDDTLKVSAYFRRLSFPFI